MLFLDSFVAANADALPPTSSMDPSASCHTREWIQSLTGHCATYGGNTRIFNRYRHTEAEDRGGFFRTFRLCAHVLTTPTTEANL